jgi:hypothetical protein
MKTNSTRLVILSIALILSGGLFFSFSLMYPDGPPAGQTGSPGDGSNCTSCHGGTTTNVDGWLTSDIPTSGYIPGSTYTFTVTNTGTGRKGFQVSPQDANGNLIGSLTAGTGTKLVGNDKYVEHSAAKSTDPAIWTFNWTAPTTGVGDVTFYGAFVSGKPNVSLEAVTISQNTASLFVENNNFQMQIFPNPVIENINIQFSLDTPERVSINLISLEGKRVKTFADNETMNGDVNLRYDISNELPKGVYLLEVRHNEKYAIERLIVK